MLGHGPAGVTEVARELSFNGFNHPDSGRWLPSSQCRNAA